MPVPISAKLKKWLPAVFCILAAMLVLISWLPILAEQFLLPSLLRKSGLAEYQVSVYRLGLGGCTLHVSGKQGSRAIISTGNVRADWSLAGLFKRRIDRLFLNGLQIHYSPNDQGKRQNFQTHPQKVEQQRESTGDQPGTSGLPLVVDRIQVIDSFITFHDKSGSHTLPLSLAAQRIHDREARKEDFTLRYKVHGHAAEQEIRAAISYKHPTRSLSGHFTGSIDLQRLGRHVGMNLPASAGIKGIADITMQTELRVAPFSLEHLQAEAHFQGLLFTYSDISVHGDGGQPPVISLRNSAQGYLLNADGLVVDGPLKAAAHFDARFMFRDEAIQWDGNIHVRPEAGQSIGQEYVLVRVPSLTLKHEGTFQDNKALVKIISPGRDDRTQGQVVVEHDVLRINAEHFGIESQWMFDAKKSPSLTSTLLLHGDGLAVTSPGVRFAVPRIRLSGKGMFPRQNDENGYALSGKLEFADASLTLDEQEVGLQGIRLELQGTWPMKENSDAGVLHIQNIVLRNTEMGHFHGTWDQSPDAITLKGELQSRLIPESQVVLNGIIRVPDKKIPLADFRFKTTDTPISLERFIPLVPALDSLFGSGQLDMEGQVTLHPGRVEGGLHVSFHDGTLEVPEAQLKAEGIHCNIDFPDLPSLSTSPEQKISIRRLTSKKLAVTDIKSSFRLESPKSLFVEKISGSWSEGRIFTSSFRLQKENPDFEAALFCDRLELAEILSQLGLAQAEGSGRLSGRVPVRFSGGKFYVDDGFLYTTPGEKGTLRIKKSEHLTAGIPADVPQFSPLHFAGAALQDFEYNWAKLHVLSENENLMLKLQIDGKPREPLPFRFDPQNNIFVRLEDGVSGGMDQPIKLDVNFNVPVNELFRYQQQLMPILRNIR